MPLMSRRTSEGGGWRESVRNDSKPEGNRNGTEMSNAHKSIIFSARYLTPPDAPSERLTAVRRSGSPGSMTITAGAAFRFFAIAIHPSRHTERVAALVRLYEYPYP